MLVPRSHLCLTFLYLRSFEAFQLACMIVSLYHVYLPLRTMHRVRPSLLVYNVSGCWMWMTWHAGALYAFIGLDAVFNDCVSV